MGYYLRGRFLGDTPAQAAKALAKADAEEVLLDYIVQLDQHPAEFIASGEVFKYTWNDLVKFALEEVRDYGQDYGKVQWSAQKSSNAGCSRGKSRCTGCGSCGSKNLAPRAPAKKKTAARSASRRC